MSECLIYQLKAGRTRVRVTKSAHLSLANALPNKVGKLDSENAVIRLSGLNIIDEHCYFENNDDIVTIHSLPGSVTVRTQSECVGVYKY